MSESCGGTLTLDTTMRIVYVHTCIERTGTELLLRSHKRFILTNMQQGNHVSRGVERCILPIKASSEH